MFVKYQLKEGLKEVKEFQLVTKMCQMRRLHDHLLNWFTLSESLCHPKWEMFCSGWGIKRVFSELFRCRG